MGIPRDMGSHPPVHRFDDARASRYRPRDGFVKTAVLIEPADPAARTVIHTRFGDQSLIGAFYVVAEGAGSYGAARREFEVSHAQVGPNRWVKSAPVHAYQIEEECVVATVVDDHLEGTVTARPGDWIVRQRTEELMVLGVDEFAERYVSDE